MRGHITKRSKNSYSIVLSLGKDPATGKRQQQWISVKGTKKDAEKRLSELLHQLDTGSFTRPTKITLREFLEGWLRDYADSHLRPKTARGYRDIVHGHLIPGLGNITLTQLKPEHLQSYYSREQECGLSAQSVRHYHNVLHKALETAVIWGKLSRNPCDAASPPSAQRPEIMTWDEDDISLFFKAAKETPYYEFFYSALYTGMRRNELLGLRWGDIDLTLGQAHVNRSLQLLSDGRIDFSSPKTAKGRQTIDLSPSLTLLLKEYRERQALNRVILSERLTDDDLVFCYSDGSPFLPDSVTHAFIKLVHRTGLKPIRLHDLRHTHASLMLKQGVHPKIVQERLGHASIQITLDTYSHVVPGIQQAAAKRFDELLNQPAEKEAAEKLG